MSFEPDFYHQGMRLLQDRFDGRRVADALDRKRKHYEFWAEELEMIRSARFFFIATAFEGHVDCSMKCGNPDFVKIVGPGTIEFPEYDGNSMYRTLGNIMKNPRVGLLFVPFDGRRRIRINGDARVLEPAHASAQHVAAKLVVSVDCEIYSNCPRYIPDLVHGKASLDPPREGQKSPAPEWKHRDYIRDILPSGDPHLADVRTIGSQEKT
jgi:predicted pyridoxine 5'-phosphate oxidase superfamily flavin-nucleotide-binding protein